MPHAVGGVHVQSSDTLAPTEVRVNTTVRAAHLLIVNMMDPISASAVPMAAAPLATDDGSADAAMVTPAVVAESETRIIPYGAPLSTYMTRTTVPDLHESKRAIAPLKIISINGMDNTQQSGSRHHDYCEPITGSRVCR
jgi:hypothetical protein